ncbi:hypothetical protein PSEUDO8O_150321 [Pseudomonas sp. 8O]|nr:hypothetical protein PSEUDO8O_150321 [Pseudomonas sp. 8O]
MAPHLRTCSRSAARRRYCVKNKLGKPLAANAPLVRSRRGERSESCSFTNRKVERDSDRSSLVFAGPPSVLYRSSSRDREQALRTQQRQAHLQGARTIAAPLLGAARRALC